MTATGDMMKMTTLVMKMLCHFVAHIDSKLDPFGGW
jgi:hypothetical protein